MDGAHLKGRQGRQEIISFNQQLFDTYVKGSRLVGKVRSVRATKVNEIKLSVPSRKMSFGSNQFLSSWALIFKKQRSFNQCGSIEPKKYEERQVTLDLSIYL
jgi:hypothetical protein